MTYHARVTAEGHVVIPDDLLRELDMKPGDTLMIDREGGRLVIRSYAQVIRDSQVAFRAMLPPGHSGSLVDELIADRRAEALRENAEDERPSPGGQTG